MQFGATVDPIFKMLSDVSIRQLMIWQDFTYSSIQCQVETPDIM